MKTIDLIEKGDKFDIFTLSKNKFNFLISRDLLSFVFRTKIKKRKMFSE